jgi:hypothetical protein
MSIDFVKALNTARQQREELIARRSALQTELIEVDRQIMQLEQAIISLTPLADNAGSIEHETTAFENARFSDGLKELGLADACRKVLQTTEMFTSPKLVRDVLEKIGYPLDRFSNPLASIHGVLKRMAESSEIVQAINDSKDVVYCWKPSVPDVPGADMYGVDRARQKAIDALTDKPKEGTGTTIKDTTRRSGLKKK